MEKKPEIQEPGKTPRSEDPRDEPAGEVGRVVREASEAETAGQHALASLLALHALQLDPGQAEASAIFERCQAALGRGQNQADAGLPPLPRRAPAPEKIALGTRNPGPRENRSIEKLFNEDALRRPLDLGGVAPLTPAPPPRGLGSRVFRATLPFLVVAFLIVGMWLAGNRTQTSSLPEEVAPAVAEPEPPAEPAAVPEADPSPETLAPGTVALNIVPWAKVDAIRSVYGGHKIEPEGLVSPCTVSLAPGRYTFTVSHPDFGSVELSVVVTAGQVTKLEHSLISNKELEKELAPSLKSAGYGNRLAGEPGIQRSAALRR